jgi:formate C-acetyltransferase
MMYKRLSKIKERRAKLSTIGTAKLDKMALAMGGYSHFMIGAGIYDENEAEYVEVAGQESQIKLDYPFPGKIPSREKGEITTDPISFAMDFSGFLDGSLVEVEPYELMVGDAHWNLWTLKGRRFPNPTRLAFLRKKANDLGADGIGWARNCPDFEIGLNLGWGGILNKVRQNYEKFLKQNKQKEFEYLKAAMIICEAMQSFIKRHSEEAKSLSFKEKDLELKGIYEKAAKACENISVKPPSNLYEALLWISFYALVDRSAVGPCAGYGRLDMVLDPFYRNDIRKGIITSEEAQELVAEFMMKRPYWYGVGGRDSNLKDATSEVSWLFLNACEMLDDFVNIAVMWHEDIDKKFFHRACEIVVNKGSGTPMLVNHDVMRQSVINFGIKEEHAWNVAYNGCAWYSVPGKEYLCGDVSGINLSKCLENALELTFKIRAKNFDEVWELFLIEVEEAIKALKELTDEEVEQYPKIWPEILPSLLSHGCIEKGRDITDLSVEYNSMIVQIVGASNVADSLIAIKKAVFDDKVVSLPVLKEALKANFEGYELIREYLLNCPKFGNDDSDADKMISRVMDSFRRKLSRYKNRFGFGYRPAMWSHLGHIYAGQMIGATPDGRKQGEPLAQGPNPMHGRNCSGISATAHSLSKLKHDELLECPYQMEIDPNLFEARNKVGLFENIVESCFKLGLVQINANIFSVDTLEKAIKQPEKFRNLMVRVTGFSARFVDLNEEAQKEIISRYRQKVS